jgi:hypothetical protein
MSAYDKLRNLLPDGGNTSEVVPPTSDPAVHRLAGPATASTGKIVNRVASSMVACSVMEGMYARYCCTLRMYIYNEAQKRLETIDAKFSMSM